MKTLIVTSAMMFLTGCSTIQSWIPSFWDDNQSAAIVMIRQTTHNIDCGIDQYAQAVTLERQLQWFVLYGDSKGSAQRDVLTLVKPMEQTAQDWRRRAESAEPSRAYCEIKKKLLIQQSDRAASAVLGRW